MRVVLLCGGLGTRLREETEFRPKALVDVGGRPILWHIMKLFAHYGLSDFVVCLGYRGEMIKQYFLNYEAMNNDFSICLGRKHEIIYHNAHAEQDFRVTLVDTGLETQTGGRLARVARYLDDGPFLVAYGDSLADVDLRALVEFHKRHGRLGTVTAVRPQSRYGLVEFSDAGAVTSFREKPGLDGWISAGFFVFEPALLSYVRDDEAVLEREPLERLARENQLMAFRHDGFFYAMDTYREYQHLNDLWSEGRAPWKVWA